mgnify:CR=1 FL=1
MIHYTLVCDQEHVFEGWFRSSEDFDTQVAGGLVACPVCGSVAISRGLMAPNVQSGRARDEREPLEWTITPCASATSARRPPSGRP